MKKRLISFLLALSMMLSLVPAGAVAQSAVPSTQASVTTTIPVESTKVVGTGGTGWTYDGKTLTLSSGTFTLSSNLNNTKVVIQSGATLLSGQLNTGCSVTNNGKIGQSGSNSPTFECSVHNYGTIEGGSFNYHMYNHKLINGGTFHKNYSVTNDAGCRIEGGTFNGTVENSGTINGGSYVTLISSTTVSKVNSVDLLVATKNPKSGTTYIINRKEGESFSISYVNDKYLYVNGTYLGSSDPLYLQSSTKTITLKTNQEIKSINGENFSGCTGSGSSYTSTINLNNYAADATLTLSTSLEPTAALKFNDSGYPIVDVNGVIPETVTGGTAYKGKGWVYKPDPENNYTKTLYVTDKTITLSPYEQGKFVAVPVETEGDIANGNFYESVICKGDISGSGRFSESVTCYGSISGTHNFDKDVICHGDISGSTNYQSTFNKGVTISSTSSTVTAGNFNGTVTNNGTIRGGNFSGTVTNNGSISTGNYSYESDKITFYSTVINNGYIHHGTFKDAVTNNGVIYGGTYKKTVTAGNGATIDNGSFERPAFEGPVNVTGTNVTIKSGLFAEPVTVTGTGAKISGGLFIKDVTLEVTANITGGVFTNKLVDGQIPVTIKNGGKFTVSGYTQYPLSTVYILPDTSLKLTAEKALGFINGKPVSPDTQDDLLSKDGKTVYFSINNLVTWWHVLDAVPDSIVLGYALVEPTADLFTVSDLPQSLTYGDSNISTQLSGITASKKDQSTDVADPTVAGFYKLTDDGKLPTNPDLLEAKDVTDAGKYAVVLKVEKETGTYSTAEALYDPESWTFTIGKKTITAADFNFSVPDNLTYDGTAKAATVTEINKVATSFNVKYTDATGVDVTAPTNAGIYKVVLSVTPDSNHKLADDSLLGPDAWTFEIAKADLTADMFEQAKDDNGDLTMTLKDKYKGRGLEDHYTVDSKPVPTSTYSMPVNAGTYQFYINADETTNYNAITGLTKNNDDGWRFVVEQYKPTKDLFTVDAKDITNITYDGNFHPVSVTADELTDAPAGPITTSSITVKYRLVGASYFTVDSPRDAGTYDVAVSFPADGNYEGADDLVLTQFTIGKKTITAEDFNFSVPDDLTYDGNAKEAKLVEKNKVANDFTFQYTDAEGTAVDKPTNAGTYNVVLSVTPDSNHKLADGSPLTSKNWTFTIEKAELTADDFEMVGTGAESTIQRKDGRDGVSVDKTEWKWVEAISTQSLKLDEMDSGKYQAYITVSATEASNYKAPAGQLTSEEWNLSVGKRDLKAADFTIVYPEDLHFSGSPMEVQPKYNGTVAIGDITVKYEKLNGDEEWEPIEGTPVETGTYRFTLDVAASKNNNSANDLSKDDDSWQFTILEPLYHVYVEGGSAYYLDEDDIRVPITEDVLVPAKTTVHLVADPDEDAGTEVALLALDAEDEDTVDDFQWYIDPRTGGKLTEADITYLTSRTDASFEMPRGDVYITTTNPAPEIVDSGAGTAVAVVLGGAAIGGVAYLAGTQIYLESVLPKGAAIPVNRQQLADLLWTTAGKPQPQSTALYADISAAAADSQKAARWCVEQGLMQAEGDNFKPGRYTFRPQVIKAWNDLQAMQKAS